MGGGRGGREPGPRDRARREGMGWEGKGKKVQGEMISPCLAPWQALLYEIQSLVFYEK